MGGYPLFYALAQVLSERAIYFHPHAQACRSCMSSIDTRL